MKRTITTGLLLIALLSAGLAQDTTVTWVSLTGAPIAQEQAALLRKVWQEEEGLWQVRDYFPEGGLQMKGAFSNVEEQTKEGQFELFAKDGTLTSVGRYQDDKAVGFWKSWYEDGVLMQQGKYLRAATEAERDSIMKRLAEMKEMAPTLHWESLKDSTWEYFHKNGMRSGLEHYLSGKLVEAQYWNEDGTEVAPDAVVNRMPQYPGGEQQLIRYLGNNIKYPNKARRKRIQGTVHIYFVINENGDIERAAVTQPVDPELDNEAMRVVQAMPKWEPGIAQNRIVKVEYRLPIRFTLQ